MVGEAEHAIAVAGTNGDEDVALQVLEVSECREPLGKTSRRELVDLQPERRLDREPVAGEGRSLGDGGDAREDVAGLGQNLDVGRRSDGDAAYELLRERLTARGLVLPAGVLAAAVAAEARAAVAPPLVRATVQVVTASAVGGVLRDGTGMPATELAQEVLRAMTTSKLKKLAALAPKLQLLLPAHNVPVADPANLSKVVVAIEQVRGGKITPSPRDGKQEYKFQGFSFLMAK